MYSRYSGMKMSSPEKPKPTPHFLFEVRRDGKTLIATRYKSAVYDKRTRASMRKAGYKLYLNGKPFKEEDLK